MKVLQFSRECGLPQTTFSPATVRATGRKVHVSWVLLRMSNLTAQSLCHCEHTRSPRFRRERTHAGGRPASGREHGSQNCENGTDEGYEVQGVLDLDPPPRVSVDQSSACLVAQASERPRSSDSVCGGLGERTGESNDLFHEMMTNGVIEDVGDLQNTECQVSWSAVQSSNRRS